MPDLHELALDVGEEGRSRERPPPAPPQPLARTAEEEPVLGPRHADIGEAALLGEARLVGLAPAERQQTVLEADDEDDGELEPLGGVKCQERHRVGAGIPEIRIRREQKPILEVPAPASARLGEC